MRDDTTKERDDLVAKLGISPAAATATLAFASLLSEKLQAATEAIAAVPADRHTLELEKLKALHEANAITVEQYAAAIIAIGDQLVAAAAANAGPEVIDQSKIAAVAILNEKTGQYELQALQRDIPATPQAQLIEFQLRNELTPTDQSATVEPSVAPPPAADPPAVPPAT